MANTNVYIEQGGSKLVVASGGELELQSGATLDIQSGATLDIDVDYDLGDSEKLTFGASEDVTMEWDGTNFVVKAAADDSLIEWGDAGSSQKSFDQKWYGNSASGADYLYFDASANLLYTTGIDVQFKDNDQCIFGTGSDVSISWDGTNLIVAAAADDSVIEIGDAGSSQKSFDLKVYGNAGAGADYLLWDASASKLTSVGAAVIAGRTDDANGIGLTLSVKTDAGAPATTGTPTGSIVYNTNDSKLYVFQGSSWLASAALS